jgi:hypothetical protein
VYERKNTDVPKIKKDTSKDKKDSAKKPTPLPVPAKAPKK